MIWLDILSWMALGATMGLWAVWFRRQHRRFWELFAVGTVGGLLGGALGRGLSEPGGALFVGRTSVLAIVLAVIGGAILAYADFKFRQEHPGPTATKREEREDIDEPSDAHRESVPHPLGGVSTPKGKRFEDVDRRH